jgi:hypothetical protein
VAKTSVNSFIRCAKALFAAKTVKHLVMVRLRDDPAAFLVMLLGLCVGLRRGEIDLSPWSALKFESTRETLRRRSTMSGCAIAMSFRVESHARFCGQKSGMDFRAIVTRFYRGKEPLLSPAVLARLKRTRHANRHGKNLDGLGA